MVNIAGSYNTEAEPQDDFGVIPAGEYLAQIIDSEIDEISKQNSKGRCLKITWQVTDGELTGRLVWQRLNLWPENMNNMDKVVQIAEGQFASVRDATGKKMPQDSTELHHIPCIIRVAIKKDPDGRYADQNEIKHVKAAGAAGAPPAAAGRQAPQPQPPARTAPAPAAQQQSRPWGGGAQSAG